MKHIIFEQIGLENFCSYKDEMILDIKENNLTLITGPNGVGKTSLFDTIPYTLYGITSKNAKGDDVVNNKVGKDCKTWIKFRINEKSYLIERYVKYKNIGNTVILTEFNDKENLVLKGQNTVKPFIENLLIPQKIFMNTIFFAQKVKSFFTDLNDSEQKEIFRKIMGLDNYVEWGKLINENLSDYETELKNLDYKIDVNLRILDDCIEKIAYYENERELWNSKKESIILNLENEIKNITLQINQLIKENVDNNLNSEIDQINNELTTSTQQLNNIDSNLNQKINFIKQQKILKENEIKLQANQQLQELTNTINSELELLKEKFNELNITKNNTLNQIDIEISNLKNEITYKSKEIKELNIEIEKYSNVDSNVECPTCMSTISGDTINKLQNHVNALKEKIKLITIVAKNLNDNIEKLIKDKENVEVKFNEDKNLIQLKVNNKRQIFTENKEVIENKLKVILQQLKQIEEKQIKEENIQFESDRKKYQNDINILNKNKLIILDQISKFEKNKIQIVTLENNIENKKNEINKYIKEVYNATNLNSYINRKNEIDENNIKLTEEKSYFNKNVEILKFWKTAFSSSGIPSMLIDEAIPFMNQRASYYLDQIAGGRYQVRFDTMKETKSGEFRDKINVIPFDSETHSNSRTQLSGGQERIIDIATILTLCDLQSNIQNISFNILLFDEIFDSLDDTNTSYISKILRILAKNKAIFLISHRHIDTIEYDELLKFEN